MPIPDLSALASSDWKERRQAVEDLARSDNRELAKGLLELIRLNHHDPNLLNASLTLLLQLKTPVADGLIALLQDPDAEVRMYSALALGEVKDPASIPALLSLLEDANRNVRFNAVEALGKLRAHQAVEPLTAILHEADFFLRFAAVQALMEIGDPRPVPDLLPLLSVDPVAPAAVQALGRLGDPQVISPILSWLETEKGEAASAVVALVDLAQHHAVQAEIAARLSQTSFQKILAAVPGAGSAQPQAAEMQFYPALAVFLGWLYKWYPCSPEETRKIISGLVCLLAFPGDDGITGFPEAAFHALQDIGEQAAPELSQGLKSSGHVQRQACAQLLSSLSDPVSIPPLLEALKAEEEATAAYAARGLGRIAHAHPEYVETLLEPLVRRLETDSPSLRQALVDTLTGLAYPALIRRVEPLLQNTDPNLRLAAVKILAQTGLGRMESAVLAALEDESPQVRRAAVEALSRLPADRALPALARFIQDERPALRAAAARALGDFSSGVKFPYAQALPLLHAALQDPDPWTRLAACRAVGRYARPESLPFLRLLKDDPIPPVRIALAEALGQIGSPEAFALLESLLADPEDTVHQAAQKARSATPGEQGADES